MSYFTYIFQLFLREVSLDKPSQENHSNDKEGKSWRNREQFDCDQTEQASDLDQRVHNQTSKFHLKKIMTIFYTTRECNRLQSS